MGFRNIFPDLAQAGLTGVERGLQLAAIRNDRDQARLRLNQRDQSLRELQESLDLVTLEDAEGNSRNQEDINRERYNILQRGLLNPNIDIETKTLIQNQANSLLSSTPQQQVPQGSALGLIGGRSSTQTAPAPATGTTPPGELGPVSQQPQSKADFLKDAKKTVNSPRLTDDVNLNPLNEAVKSPRLTDDVNLNPLNEAVKSPGLTGLLGPTTSELRGADTTQAAPQPDIDYSSRAIELLRVGEARSNNVLNLERNAKQSQLSNDVAEFPAFVLSLVNSESSFNPNAVSETNARGLGQFTTIAATQLSEIDPRFKPGAEGVRQLQLNPRLASLAIVKYLEIVADQLRAANLPVTPQNLIAGYKDGVGALRQVNGDYTLLKNSGSASGVDSVIQNYNRIRGLQNGQT